MIKHFVSSLAFACCLFSAASVFGQTYTTIANGNWSSPATWQGGSIPPTAVALPAGATINLRHTVSYDTGNTPFTNQGEVRIQPAAGTTARLNLPTGITFETLAGGKFYVINGSLIQCRFAPCNDGEPYAGNTPGAQQNTGTFRNLGGLVEVRSAIVEIAEFWINYGGTEVIVDSCMTLGHTFALKGTANAFSTSTISRSSISMGWHGDGQFELANGNVYFQGAKFQLAGENNAGFNLLFGTANGDIDYITLRNHIVPFTGPGLIYASDMLNTSTLNLDAFCATGKDKYQDNNKISGSQSLNCGLPFFPASCSVLIPSSAGATIEGRVSTANGAGIAKAVIEISGGRLTQPLRAVTNGFGLFRFQDVPVGETYVVSISAKQYFFSESARALSLLDDMTNVDFIATPVKRGRQ